LASADQLGLLQCPSFKGVVVGLLIALYIYYRIVQKVQKNNSKARPNNAN